MLNDDASDASQTQDVAIGDSLESSSVPSTTDTPLPQPSLHKLLADEKSSYGSSAELVVPPPLCLPSLPALNVTADECISTESLSRDARIAFQLADRKIEMTADPKRQMRRLHALQELLDTEENYVADLGNLVRYCFEPMTQLAWMPEEHCRLLMRNVKELLELQESFLVALRAVFHESDVGLLRNCDENALNGFFPQVSFAFLARPDVFSAYSEFCSLHDTALVLVNEWKKDTRWNAFLDDAVAKMNAASSVSNKLQFKDYFIKPVQRICRYPLMLKEISKLTPDGTSESTRLESVLNMMKSVASDVDEAKRQRENLERSYKFCERLEPEPVRMFLLNERYHHFFLTYNSLQRLPNGFVRDLGEILLAGALDVVSYESMPYKIRCYGCFLFNTYLLVIRAKKSNCYELKHWFPLHRFELVDLEDNEGIYFSTLLTLY